MGLDVVAALSFEYYGRNPKEASAMKEICEAARCDRIISFGLPDLREVGDYKDDSQFKISPRMRRAPRAYIPARNVIFYGAANYIAELIGSNFIVGGHNRDDLATFPDSSSRFFRRLNEVTKLGLYTKGETGRIILPLSRLRKAQVIKLGKRLGVPFELTWSCQESEDAPCMKCHSCLLRRQAFQKAGIEDPLDEKRSF
jgi:7-cyano-7-deazaguanine synthase